MKFLSIFILIGCLHASAVSKAQVVSLSWKNAHIETVFKDISRQAGVNFIYTRESISNTNPVTVELKEVSLEQALRACFTGQPLNYSIEGKYITVKSAPLVLKTGNSTDLSGIVTNEIGEPLAGVSISIKNSDRIYSTDNNGAFVIRGADPASVLVFSSVGYETVSEQINGRSRVAIRLRVSVSRLDETVVIGYGTTTRRYNLGSVGKLSSADIEKQPVSNILSTLAGRIPGVIITQNSGLPGANISVLIRGRSSIQSGITPLFIIDGVPFIGSSDRITQLAGQVNANSPFSTINPADIESIEVLKDADATAIYGSKGANGVILITTKKGLANKTSVDLNVYNGWGRPARLAKLMNTEQYLSMRREALANDTLIPTPANDPDLTLWDQSKYTDWSDELIGNIARQDNYQLTVSGGSQNTRFNISGNYGREKTVFIGNYGGNRYSLTMSMAHQSNDKKFTANFNASTSKAETNLLPEDLTRLKTLPPNYPGLFDSLGGLVWQYNGNSLYNPLGILRNRYNSDNERLAFNGAVNYRLLPSLTIRVNGGFTKIGNDEKLISTIAGQDPSSSPLGSASFGSSKTDNWIFEPQAEYSTGKAQKSLLKILFGGSWQESKFNSSLLSGTEYTSDALIESIAAAGRVTAKNSEALYRYSAVFGRINYVNRGKYLVNMSGRRDASSRFGPGKQFANFWAAGAGWIFSEYDLVKKKLAFLSFGKIRGSYGTTGNDQIASYSFLDTWRTTTQSYQGQPGLIPSRLFNPDYSWEEIRKTELGLEMGFLKNRIFITAGWYRNLSVNQIILYNQPSQTGFTNILRNFPGRVENNGWEFELKTNNLSGGKLNWYTSLNLSVPVNKLVSFPDLATSSYASDYQLGKPLNSRIGYRYTGIDPLTGLYTFKDQNKDGKLDKSDMVWLGTRDRKWFGGIVNNLTWKGFELDFLIEVVKQLGIEPVFASSSLAGTYYANQPVEVSNRWQQPGDNVMYQRYLSAFGSAAYFAGGNASSSDAVLTDASFLRLKNLSFSWRLPEKVVKKAHMTGTRLYLQAQNLITLTSYKIGDPEAQSIISVPPLRMITAGIHLTF
ncbi:MAG: SusC/RagA family TonB-linked outer membrane protein [Gemmatimonadaceae bacterium]|nr:SusC/RagA family TonB-linked outer membrane protein [Chitinophagaceae bacterium]